jgi:glycosyltransferase involved in cell wall biosynthesis
VRPRLVSVIIPVRNAAAHLPNQLGALAAQSYAGAWELVVADNGSTDQTVAVAHKWVDRIPNLRVIDASRRVGINCARNEGARAANGDLLLFCDADDEATSGWIEGMVTIARSCDLIGGRLDRQTLNDPVVTKWRSPGPEDRLPVGYAFLEYAEGANVGIWSSVLHELGGWNEDYIIGGDDIELSWRAQLAGYRLGFAPDGVVRYRYRMSLMAAARQMFRYGYNEPRLRRDFGRRGVPRYGLRRRLVDLLRFGGRSWHVLGSRQMRGQWACTAAYGAGRIWGGLCLPWGRRPESARAERRAIGK